MTSAGVNYLAILIATIAAFAFGAAYYSVLSKPWIRASRVDTSQAKPLWPLLVNSFVCLLIMAWVLATLIGYFGEVSFSAKIWRGRNAGTPGSPSFASSANSLPFSSAGIAISSPRGSFGPTCLV